MSIPPKISGRTRWHLGGLLTIAAAAGDTNGALAVVEQRAPRGYATPPHVHGREDETLYVVEGELRFIVDGVPGKVAAGSAVHLPRGLPHHFEVLSAEAHYLVIITPGGFEQFFLDVSPPASATRIPGTEDHAHTDPQRMIDAAAAWGTTVFRKGTDALLAAVRTVETSNDQAGIIEAYGVLGAALDVPASLDDVIDPLVGVVADRLRSDPVHARALVLLGILIERSDSRWDFVLPLLLSAVHPDLGEATLLAFAYLLAHFPDDADAVRTAMEPVGLPEPDWHSAKPDLLALMGAKAVQAVEGDASLDVMGANCNDDYHLGPVDGPGLDLGIDSIRVALPELFEVRATAHQLPFASGSLGAVNCSNALHLFPDPRKVIQEIGRCLRHNGVFTARTFRQAERPTYRYFQQQREKMFNVRSFRVDELVSWLTTAGLELTDLHTPAGAVLFAARRTSR
jgi:quercetin dioxygenase-like cupin family protein